MAWLILFVRVRGWAPAHKLVCVSPGVRKLSQLINYYLLLPAISIRQDAKPASEPRSCRRPVAFAWPPARPRRPALRAAGRRLEMPRLFLKTLSPDGLQVGAPQLVPASRARD